MNSAYTNLINNIPGQINFSDQILNYQSSHGAAVESPILSHLYNPAYANAQSRILSSLQLPSHNNQGSPSPNEAPSPHHTNSNSSTNLSTEHSNLPIVHDQQKPPHSPTNIFTGSPIASSANQFYPNNSNSSLYCDFNSAWRSAANMMAADHNPYINYENSAWANSYGCIGNTTIDLNTARRKNATRESTSTLKAWLQEHIKNPYPTKGEKIMLAIITKMTLTQVSTWFANARRRLKKENKMTWSPKNRSDNDDCGASSNGDNDLNHNNADADDDDEVAAIKKEKKELADDAIRRINDGNRSDGLSDGRADSRGKPPMGFTHSLVNSNFNLLNEVKPKIWSLAQTATSNLFPNPYEQLTNPHHIQHHLHQPTQHFPATITGPNSQFYSVQSQLSNTNPASVLSNSIISPHQHPSHFNPYSNYHQLYNQSPVPLGSSHPHDYNALQSFDYLTNHPLAIAAASSSASLYPSISHSHQHSLDQNSAAVTTSSSSVAATPVNPLIYPNPYSNTQHPIPAHLQHHSLTSNSYFHEPTTTNSSSSSSSNSASSTTNSSLCIPSISNNITISSTANSLLSSNLVLTNS